MDKVRAMDLFREYMKLTGVSEITRANTDIPEFYGKKLGIVNGSNWITLWSTYFGKTLLPGVKLINVGNEAIQLNFMQAHEMGHECPPKTNIEKIVRYARDLCELEHPDVILSTCSTMNRSLPYLKESLLEFSVPIVQIDEPMMEKAVSLGPKIFVIATHGPTVKSTFALLEETAQRMPGSMPLTFFGATTQEAFELLGAGKLEEHNEAIARQIRRAMSESKPDCVVLAQLSMSIFKIQYPDAQQIFGVPVLTSGEEGFMRVGEILAGKFPPLN